MKKIKRIFILGSVGSGKSFLAKKLAKKIKCKHYHLDDIYWRKKYTEREDHKKRNHTLRKISSRSCWIIEGVYGDWTTQAINKSDLVVLLDFPTRTLIFRILKRYLAGDYEMKKAGLRGVLRLMKYALIYKKDKNSKYGFEWHKKIACKNNKCAIIKNKNEMDKLIGELK